MSRYLVRINARYKAKPTGKDYVELREGEVVEVPPDRAEFLVGEGVLYPTDEPLCNSGDGKKSKVSVKDTPTKK